MISYLQTPGASDAHATAFFDILFLKGSEINEAARMNRDLRCQIQRELAFKTFAELRLDGHTEVSLYGASEHTLALFLSTCLYEPCLKVSIKGLRKKQIDILLKNIPCQKGIIECNQFTDDGPSINLREATFPDDLPEFRPVFKAGQILVYDIKKNEELIEQVRPAMSIMPIQPRALAATVATDKSIEKSQTAFHLERASTEPVNDELLTAVDEKEAEEFSSLIKRILNTSPASAGSPPTSPPLQRRDSVQRRDSERRRDTKPRSHTPRLPKSPHVPPSTQALISPQRSDASEYTQLFERLLRSFREQMSGIYGHKTDDLIQEAETHARVLIPDLTLQALNDNVAIGVLDLIQHLVAQASLLKRNRLRQAALSLVGELYNKHYELLEQHHVIDKVEQCYYRLKK
jgi:hypothetical protein